MELEEMQSIWSELSDQLEKQKKLTDKMIIMMTQEKYRKKINKVAYPETIGAIICYSAVAVILFNIQKLDTWYNLLAGVLCVLILIILPMVSLKFLYGIRNIDIANNSFKETLLNYAKRKKRFQKSMKWSYYLGFILMFAIMPVTAKIVNDKDIFLGVNSTWTLVTAIPLAILFFIVFSKWTMKWYSKNVNSAESLIKDLEESGL
ncbi:hypothetical protein M0D21_01615 [Aquimarina sp. D1M17]|uniref:hypothetical protein n=1 Tax=Aquimarina acroporae TaxID=2937283 RepID=UPI0020BDA4E3|nr:hypothetical protein [Aquimarina acroporae]MCK8520242.1 hypothetical protein [Aquimarina acroporae]